MSTGNSDEADLVINKKFQWTCSCLVVSPLNLIVILIFFIVLIIVVVVIVIIIIVVRFRKIIIIL